MSSRLTKEQYQSLSLKELRGIAKERGMRSTTSLRKEALIDRMLAEDAKEAPAEQTQADQQSQSERTERAPEAVQENRTETSAGEASGAPEQAEEDRGRRERNSRVQGARSGRYMRDNSERNDRSEKGGPRVNRRRYEPENHDSDRAVNPEQSQQHQEYRENERREETESRKKKDQFSELDSGEKAHGILEVMADGYGFIRSDNFLPGEDDIYVAPSQIRKFHLQTGDMLTGGIRVKSGNEKFSALLYVESVNGLSPEKIAERPRFDDMTPIFPNERIHLERPGGSVAMRIIDLVSPIGKGQRGMIVSPPKAGKTTLLKEAAKSILVNNPEMHVIILLIDERPEEVTDIKETVTGKNVEVIYSTFDELPEHHKRVSEMVIERAKRLVENKQDVIIFIDSITRLARAYNQLVPPSGRTLSGGLDPAALHMPKRFFGAARNMREGGSLTILATALVDTGSKMDDVVYEEFKGTGNMELVLDRKLQERRVFPAIDLAKSGTRREDLLLNKDEEEAVTNMRRALSGQKAEEVGETILNMFTHTKTNRELVMKLKTMRL